MTIEKAAVVGAGTMGAGIAQVLSQAGIEVILKDISQEYVDRGLANIKRMYESRVKKSVFTADQADKLFRNVKGSTTYDGFDNVDLVIEAALEQIEIKLEIFRTLDEHCQPKAILASNTSALSISEIAQHTKRPSKVIGMHFFNPAQTMKLVEVIPGLKTDDDTVSTIMDLCRKTNKIPVRVNECPGFLVNRVLFPYLNEALYTLCDGNATIAEIDQAAVAFGLPMGPFTLFDMTGLDVCLHVTDFLYNEYGQRFEPAPILTELVKRGHLGQKSGRGFFTHEKGAVSKETKEINPDLAPIMSKLKKSGNGQTRPFAVERIILPMFNEALYAIQEKVIEPMDVDVAMEHGCGLKRGLMSLAKEKGFEWCLNELTTYQKAHGERFRPAWFLRKLVRAGVHDFSQMQTAVNPKSPVGAR